MIGPVVSVEWWQQHRGEVVLADVRWYLDGRSGQEAYDAGHLPGAVFVDLDRWLAAGASPEAGRHPLPDPAVFADGMAGLGIADDTTVVAYDDAGGTIAARLVWMLRVTGHAAALLDGGLPAYQAALQKAPLQKAPLQKTRPERPAARFTPRPWPAGRLAGLGDATDPGLVVLDARDRSRYRGDSEPVDPRPGHIPGARNLPCRENLAPDGTFLPIVRLRERLAGVGATDAAQVVSYCGSGVTACHNLLALEYAGLGEGRLFPGSWSQYSHTSRPAALGDEPAKSPKEAQEPHGGRNRGQLTAMSAMDKLKNKLQVGKGRAKEKAGRATDNPRLEGEGRADRVEGNTKQVGEQVKDAGKNVRDAFKH